MTLSKKVPFSRRERGASLTNYRKLAEIRHRDTLAFTPTVTQGSWSSPSYGDTSLRIERLITSFFSNFTLRIKER